MLILGDSPILNRYKTCTDAESVLAMQEVMILEMEQEDDERRAYRLKYARCIRLRANVGLAKESQDADGDLLVENPNHSGAAWRPYHSESESEEEEDEEQTEKERLEAIEALSHMLNAIHAS